MDTFHASLPPFSYSVPPHNPPQLRCTTLPLWILLLCRTPQHQRAHDKLTTWRLSWWYRGGGFGGETRASRLLVRRRRYHMMSGQPQATPLHSAAYGTLKWGFLFLLEPMQRQIQDQGRHSITQCARRLRLRLERSPHVVAIGRRRSIWASSTEQCKRAAVKTNGRPLHVAANYGALEGARGATGIWRGRITKR